MGASRKFALGAIVGITAGVIAGMLTAPKSGKETRSDIRKKAADMKGDAADTVDHAMGKAEEYMHRAEGMIRDFKEDMVGGKKDRHDSDLTEKGPWEK